jgi:hypothetical protein
VRVNTTIQQKQIASNKNLAETFQFWDAYAHNAHICV